MADFDRSHDPRLQVELRSAAAELLVLRRALEAARDEARNANVSACRAETALDRQRASMEKALARERARTAEAKRSTHEWRKRCKSAEKEYNRVTSTLVWRIYSRFDRALHRAHSILRRRRLDPRSESGWASDLPKTFTANLHHAIEPFDDVGHEDGINGNEERALKRSVEKDDVGTILSEAENKHSTNFSRVSTRAVSSSTSQVPDLSSLRAMTPRGRIAVVLHLYYPELWPEFRDALSSISEPSDLFVTLTAGYSDDALDWIRADYPSAQIITLENRGRDILPFVVLINSGLLFRYELICKLHTKRSIQGAGTGRRSNGNAWRRDLLDGVLSDADYVGRVLTAFDTDPELGYAVASGFRP
jgi:Rhamnan synthesis protein F